MIKQPIGVFDSGIGGLTVVVQMRKISPWQDIVYFGDTARVPYGTKSESVVREFSAQNTEFLLKFNPKLVVIACHTASCLAAGYLRKRFPGTAFLDVVKPSIRKAVSVTRSGRVGVIGTPATINSGVYQSLLRKADPAVRVWAVSCPLFVPLVEEGWGNSRLSREAARIYLRDLRGRKVDTVILGCTHYPLMKKAIRQVLGPDVHLVDASEEVAVETGRLLKSEPETVNAGLGRLLLYFSDCSSYLKSRLKVFLQEKRMIVKEVKSHF